MSACRDTAQCLRTLPFRPGGFALLLALLAWASPTAANSIRVTQAAAMAETQHGLEITLQDASRTPPSDAWVAVGPEKGLQQETELYGRFWLDLQSLRMPASSGQAVLPFLALMKEDAAEPQEIVTLFISQSEAGQWILGAWVLDEPSGEVHLAGAGPLVPAPHCPVVEPPSLPIVELPSLVPCWSWLPRTLVEFEWGSGVDGEPGYLAVYRRLDGGSVREPILERQDLASAAQSVSHLLLGVRAVAHPAATHGVVRIDELAIHRGLLPAANR